MKLLQPFKGNLEKNKPKNKNKKKKKNRYKKDMIEIKKRIKKLVRNLKTLTKKWMRLLQPFKGNLEKSKPKNKKQRSNEIKSDYLYNKYDL